MHTSICRHSSVCHVRLVVMQARVMGVSFYPGCHTQIEFWPFGDTRSYFLLRDSSFFVKLSDPTEPVV